MSFLAVVGWLVARLPARFVPPFGRALGWLAGSVLRIRRADVDAALASMRVDSPGAEREQIARAVYANLGIGLAELLAIAGGGAPCGPTCLAPEATDALEAALARGPVILAASHTGNWELAAAAAARWLTIRGRRLVVVAKPIKDLGVDRFVGRLRARLGVTTIPPRGALAAAGRALAAGDVVVMPIDQVPERARHGVVGPFLGRPALLDRAPALLAARAKASLLVVAARREAPGDAQMRAPRAQHVELLDEHRPTRATVDHVTQRATAALDRFVRTHPAAWFWLHRRWRLGPREASRTPGARAAEPARREARFASTRPPPGLVADHEAE